MPQLHTSKLAPPQSADEFENMCVDALTILWGASAQRNGRSGQAQHGVDIFARAGREYLGAQCKNRTSVGIADIVAEAEKALGFTPRLVDFVLVTSGPRDAVLQEQVRVHFAEFAFPVSVLFWDDVVQELAKDDRLIKKYWSQGVPESSDLLGEVEHFLHVLRRLHELGSSINVRSYREQPSEFVQLCDAPEFSAAWQRLSPRLTQLRWSDVHQLSQFRAEVDLLVGAAKEWDSAATDFQAQARAGPVHSKVSWALKANARKNGVRMHHSASAAIRLLERVLQQQNR